MDQARFRILQTRSDISSLTEVWVLINSAWDQTRNVVLLAKDLRERVGERRCRLNRNKVCFTDTVAIGETKGSFGLVDGDHSGDANDVGVECTTHVIEIGEDEGFVEFEAACDDVAGVFEGEIFHLFDFERGFEEELFVIGELDHQGAIENVLEPFGEEEGDQVSQVHRVRTWSSACVEVEGLALFVAVEDLVELTVGEEASSSEQRVCLPASELFESGEELRVDLACTELFDKLVIVNSDLLTVDGGSFDVPGCDLLFGGSGDGGLERGVSDAFCDPLGRHGSSCCWGCQAA